MQIRAKFTESLIKRTTMRFWIRFIAWHGFAAVALGIALLTYWLLTGDSSWYVGAFGAVLVLAIFTGSSVYCVYRNRALATLRRMIEPTVTMDFSDAGISTQSDLGGGNLSWRAITKIWTFPEAWLVFTSEWHYFTIPTDALTDDIQQFINRKVLEHGGKVR